MRDEVEHAVRAEKIAERDGVEVLKFEKVSWTLGRDRSEMVAHRSEILGVRSEARLGEALRGRRGVSRMRE